MSRQQAVTQVENRSERVSLRLRPKERWALRVVAANENLSESDILRRYNLQEIVAEAIEINPKIAAVA